MSENAKDSEIYNIITNHAVRVYLARYISEEPPGYARTQRVLRRPKRITGVSFKTLTPFC